jgi:predicted aspartyl protease
MVDEMGTFRTDVELENPASRGARLRIGNVLVDTGAELSCFPSHVLETLGVARQKRVRFRQADGSMFERWTGDAILYAAGTRTVDEVIFGEPEDIVLLGARSLEGLNRRVDAVTKSLVDAGPVSLATVA